MLEDIFPRFAIFPQKLLISNVHRACFPLNLKSKQDFTLNIAYKWIPNKYLEMYEEPIYKTRVSCTSWKSLMLPYRTCLSVYCCASIGALSAVLLLLVDIIPTNFHKPKPQSQNIHYHQIVWMKLNLEHIFLEIFISNVNRPNTEQTRLHQNDPFLSQRYNKCEKQMSSRWDGVRMWQFLISRSW